jgi:hypothetical protein
VNTSSSVPIWPRVDVHDQHAARLATISPVLPEVWSCPTTVGAVADQRHLRECRPDVGDPPGERAALDDHHVALRNPVVGALVERDHLARVERVAADDARRDGLVVEAALQLEGRGELVVLALEGLEASVRVLVALVLALERGVVDTQRVDS